MQKRFLAIISVWPSKEHPYLVHLFYQLKLHYPNMQLFLFKKAGDIEFAERLIGKEGVELVLKDALYRFQHTKNILAYIVPLVCILKRFKLSHSLYKTYRNKGYSVRQSTGQVLYVYALIGKKFDMLYINALQIARHFPMTMFSATPIVCSSRGQDFDFAPVGHYDDILRRISRLHVLGSYLKNKAVSRGLSADQITIIPPAILPVHNTNEHDHLTQHSITILSASRLFWSKGYIYALRSIHRLVRLVNGSKKIRYLIFGDGPELEFIKVEIARLNLENVISLMGWTDQHVIDGYLRKADIYVLLSIEEGFNNSVMQAQHVGIPCVVADAGGLPENVVHDKTGYVVPRYDSEKAADYLYKLTMDEELRKTMGQAAKARIINEFSLETQVSKYRSMFDNILK